MRRLRKSGSNTIKPDAATPIRPSLSKPDGDSAMIQSRPRTGIGQVLGSKRRYDIQAPEARPVIARTAKCRERKGRYNLSARTLVLQVFCVPMKAH